MRPPEHPRRPSRPNNAQVHDKLRRRRVIGIVAIVVVFFLASSLRGIADFYTEYLWFASLRETGVWGGVLGAKVVLALLFSLVAFVILLVNLWLADRFAPMFSIATTEDEVVLKFHEFVGHRRRTVRVVIAGVLGVIIGSGASTQWNNWILFTNQVSFGKADATYHTDIGFYVFRLPFLQYVVAWLFTTMLVAVVMTVIANYFNGSIQVQPATHVSLRDRVTPAVKAHVSILLAVMALVKTAQYWLARYEMVFSTRGTVDGSLYTDSNVQLKALYLLLMISVFACVLFVVNIWRKGWALPVMAVGLWAVVSIVAGVAVPSFVQRFRVEPSESTMESKYLRHNIDATRDAFGLAKIDVKTFDNDGKLNAPDLQKNAATVQNVRLWDPSVMREVYNRLQGIRSFYEVGDPDIDRYEIDGELTQVLTANRNLDSAALPNKSWESGHLAYTHGYGNVMAATNAADRGQPVFTNEEIPVRSTSPDTKVSQPGTYFGEGMSGYVITNSKRTEIDYTDAEGNTKFTTYDGNDGIRVGSGLSGTVKKAAFALRFADVNPLISSNVVGSSKVHLYRDVAERVRHLAPFISFDADPYVVVRSNGRLQYVIDGYTTTSHYPNAQRAVTSGLPGDSGLNERFNYVRNSVKAVVDAYDGTITLYVVDDSDPLIKAYRKAFPSLFTDGDKVPADLAKHFRYPEDLFRVQTQMYGRYHLTDPQGFYTQENAWEVSADPNKAGLGGASSGQVDANGNAISSSANPMDPYYLLMRLPGDTDESFLLLRPFVPSQSGANSKQLLTGFMTADSDPEQYGKLTVYQLPANNLPSGPYNIAAQMMQDKKVSTTQSLLCNTGQAKGGSECEYGNLLLIPIEQSLLYVRPWYVKAAGNSIPELTQVIVGYQDESGATHVAVESTFRGALVDLFGSDVPKTHETRPLDSVDLGSVGANSGNSGSTTTTTAPPTTTPGATGGTKPTTTVAPGKRSVDQLIGDLAAAFERADEKLAAKDLEGYAREIDKARAIAEELDKAKASGGKASGN